MLEADRRDLPVTPIEGLIGLPPSGKGRRHCLVLAAAGRCIEVSGPVGLETVDGAVIHPLPPLVAARMTLAGVRALAMAPSGPVLILDLRQLHHRYDQANS